MLTRREWALCGLIVALALLAVYFAVNAYLPSLTIRVEPRSGAGWAQTFHFLITSSQGAGQVRQVSVSIGPRVAGPDNCYLIWDSPVDVLVEDDRGGMTWKMANLGKPGRTGNAQCTVEMRGSGTRRVSRGVLDLKLAVTFSRSYRGTHNVFAMAADGELVTEWRYIGKWTVPDERDNLPRVR